ncbi:hydroxyethylthiazole kinase [Dyella humicola]|uniref:hydroxyethylthiazole kinase n=1 Tax=Dyella humicola TaxID=2992126 RepID=UPI002253C499|nr:hydroxyethylthiazole kinase [Dyella humicola]
MSITQGDELTSMRATAPLVHCITNYVAMNMAANVLLAAGASPAMLHAQEEVAEFASLANALTINIGTLSSPWLAAMKLAAASANASRTPWVLDPVAHHATAFRRSSINELIDLRPTIIRGNASEIITLSGGYSESRGVDSLDSVAAAEDAAVRVARQRGSIVAVTGAADFVTDGDCAARLTGGSPLMPRITALGCSLTCMIGAFAGARPTHLLGATVSALAYFKLAGELAGQQAAGPGSFAWRFLDALASIEQDDLNAWMEHGVVTL